MRTFISAVIAVFLFCSCSKAPANGKLAIYKLSSFQAGPGNCQVVAATAVLEANALVDDRDILHYDPSHYKYTLTANAAHTLNELPGRTQLALTVDDEVIFLFNHQSVVLSSICPETITMTVIGDEMTVNLVRNPPGAQAGFPAPITDNRNDGRVISLLAAQGKL